MSLEAQKATWELGDALEDLPQDQKVYYVRQLLIDLMDCTEQTDDEKIWCGLNEKIKELYPNYLEYETLINETK